jgi:hypothetical protein
MSVPVNLLHLVRFKLYKYIHIFTFLSCLGLCNLSYAQIPGIDLDQESFEQLKPKPLNYSLDITNATVVYNQNGESEPVITGINIQKHDVIFKTQTIETLIAPQQQIEYMINMDEGDVLLYSWHIDGQVYFDLHGHQDNVDTELWTRYEEGAENSRHGSITAPYTGEHGWFWANIDSKPVKLTLRVTGYYKNIYRIDL